VSNKFSFMCGLCPLLIAGIFLLTAASVFGQTSLAASRTQKPGPEKLIIDTDIGDDVDDAFAVALALKSPELNVLGITTTFGDTEERARLLDRFLLETGYGNIPVAAGVPTRSVNPMSQRAYAEGAVGKTSHANATDFIMEQIRRYPDQITLVAIGPLVNIGALLNRDAASFKKLRRLVMMGGSIHRGYGDLGYTRPHGPEPEWNIKNDIPSARKLFSSGVPIFMMPLDSTQLKLDEVKRAILFAAGTPLTDALTLLYHQWGQQTPTLFDAMTVAYILNPALCPVTSMRISVEPDGMTRAVSGDPNAEVCLASDPEAFFHFLLPRLMAPLASSGQSGFPFYHDTSAHSGNLR
jgi:purine nucleosidase